MKLIKNSKVAAVICLVVIVLSVALGSRRSLQKACDRVEQSFYTGVEADGYLHKSVASQLKMRMNNANGALSLTGDYAPTETENARQIRQDLYSALEYQSSPSYLFQLNGQLTEAMQRLDKAMAGAELPESDQKAYEKYYSDFNAAMDVIEDSGYNEAVQDFNTQVLQRFPANIIQSSGVQAPGLFA